MNKRTLALVLVTPFIVGTSRPVEGAENTFHRLKGAQIRARFAGMELTDGAHWGDVYHRDGTLTSISSGSKGVGHWHLDKDNLCTEWPGQERRCYEVSASGPSIRLQQPGHARIDEGTLQKPETGNR